MKDVLFSKEGRAIALIILSTLLAYAIVGMVFGLPIASTAGTHTAVVWMLVMGICFSTISTKLILSFLDLDIQVKWN